MSLPQPQPTIFPSFDTPAEPFGDDLQATPGTDQALQRSVTRRLFLPIAGGLLLLSTILAAGVWWHYQAGHVVSRNALVRSHLTELGIRGEGVVAEILVRAGDRVRKGEVLAQLDNRHLIARRAQTDARLHTLDEQIRVEEASLDLAREKAQIDLAGAQSAYRRMQAEAEAANVQAEDSRAFHAARQALAPEGAVSAEVLRDAAAKAAMRVSLATAADAAASGSYSELQVARLAEDEISLREGELRVLRAKRQELVAELQRIDADIDSTRVIAPADGAVIRRLAQPGMAVSTGTPLLSLWLTEETWIEAWIPEENLGDLEAGSEVAVSFPALPRERFSGRVERVGLATDFEMPLDYLPQTRESRMRPTPQIGVQIRLDAPPALVRPGMSAIVDIRVNEV